MGNDGGTIVKRLDIVKLRNDGSDAKVDPAILAKVRATTCSLSHQPLRIPIVADRIGNLYNKDSILKYLISKSDSQGESDVGKKADRIAGHIRGLKDVQTLKPTENSACKNSTKKSEQDEDKPAPFICPLNQREMNGRHRFIYIRQCGCMMSSSGLIATISDQLANNSKEQREGTDQIENTVCCPICATNFSANCFRKNEIIPGMDVIILNGSETEVQAQRISMENDRAAEQARKKEAKAKKNESTDLDKKQRKEEKRKRKEEAVTEVDQDVKRIRHADQKPPNKSDLVAH
jgi:Rtf2 RING-finger